MREGEQCVLVVVLDGAERIANPTIPSFARLQQPRPQFFDCTLEGILISVPLDKNAVERIP